MIGITKARLAASRGLHVPLLGHRGQLGTPGAVITDPSSVLGHDAPLINGADNTFSDPLVMNYPAGNPVDHPRPQLNVQPEATYSNNTVFDNQEWGVQAGPLS